MHVPEAVVGCPVIPVFEDLNKKEKWLIYKLSPITYYITPQSTDGYNLGVEI